MSLLQKKKDCAGKKNEEAGENRKNRIKSFAYIALETLSCVIYVTIRLKGNENRETFLKHS